MPTYGIGGGGIVGIAIEQLSPVTITSATATAGGSLTAGTYKYIITALNASGESHAVFDNGTPPAKEVSVTTSAGNLTATLNWSAVTGATGYKVYRTAAAGASGSELNIATLGLVTTFADTAVGSPSGAPPTSNTALTSGTYAAPTKFFPLTTESMKTTQQTIYRRGIRQLVDPFGAVAGNTFVEGDLELEGLDDVVPYFLLASRATVVRTGSAPNFVYTATPNAVGSLVRTMSITVVRNSQVFGYTGCVVGQQTFGVSDGLLSYKASIVGNDEATQTTPVPVYSTTSVPYGAGTWNFQIPTSTQIFDVDGFELSVNDNPEPQFRLKNSGRGAQWVKFGERESKLSFQRDFPDRTEYDLFKSVTATTVTIVASRGANNTFTFTLPNNVRDTYEVSLGSQGDIVRASQDLMVMFDQSGGNAYTFAVKTQEVLYP